MREAAGFLRWQKRGETKNSVANKHYLTVYYGANRDRSH